MPCSIAAAIRRSARDRPGGFMSKMPRARRRAMADVIRGPAILAIGMTTWRRYANRIFSRTNMRRSLFL
ncbi:MAG TPA: hypothetical protein VNT79_14730 [Phycisphaerae bacterium]|nr:hypothetical protein [Phycisphaerae bacterium]